MIRFADLGMQRSLLTCCCYQKIFRWWGEISEIKLGENEIQKTGQERKADSTAKISCWIGHARLIITSMWYNVDEYAKSMFPTLVVSQPLCLLHGPVHHTDQ